MADGRFGSLALSSYPRWAHRLESRRPCAGGFSGRLSSVQKFSHFRSNRSAAGSGSRRGRSAGCGPSTGPCSDTSSPFAIPYPKVRCHSHSPREPEHRSGHDAGPKFLRRPLRRGGDRQRVDDEIARLVNLPALVPGGVGVELDAERSGQHGGGQALRVFAALGLGPAEPVMLRDVAVDARIGGPRQADAGRDAPTGLVGLAAGEHTIGDLAGLQRGNARLARDQLASRRQDRGDADEVLLLDVGIAQGNLEGGKLVAMHARAAGEEYALRDLAHDGSDFLPLPVKTGRGKLYRRHALLVLGLALEGVGPFADATAQHHGGEAELAHQEGGGTAAPASAAVDDIAFALVELERL